MKTLRIEGPQGSRLVLEIDDEKINEELIEQYVSFWVGGKDTAETYFDGDCYHLYAVMVCRNLLDAEGIRNQYQAIAHFDWDKRPQEGFPNMDGQDGFRIVDWTPMYIDYDDFAVCEHAEV